MCTRFTHVVIFGAALSLLDKTGGRPARLMTTHPPLSTFVFGRIFWGYEFSV
jgi:hypothetical protein